MLVIKKNGSKQDFDIDKVKTSLLNCKCTENCYLNEGDINMISKGLNKILAEINKDNDITSTYEIRGIIYHVLMENGFKNVAKAYMKF